MIEAILVPRRLDAVRELLLQRGCQEVIVSEVLSEGGPKLNYRGLTYKGEAYRVKVQTIVADSGAMPTAEAFSRATRRICKRRTSCGSTGGGCDTPSESGKRTRWNWLRRAAETRVHRSLIRPQHSVYSPLSQIVQSTTRPGSFLADPANQDLPPDLALAELMAQRWLRLFEENEQEPLLRA